MRHEESSAIPIPTPTPQARRLHSPGSQFSPGLLRTDPRTTPWSLSLPSRKGACASRRQRHYLLHSALTKAVDVAVASRLSKTSLCRPGPIVLLRGPRPPSLLCFLSPRVLPFTPGYRAIDVGLNPLRCWPFAYHFFLSRHPGGLGFILSHPTAVKHSLHTNRHLSRSTTRSHHETHITTHNDRRGSCAACTRSSGRSP